MGHRLEREVRFRSNGTLEDKPRVDQTKTNTKSGPRRPRSATAPTARIGLRKVKQQNVSQDMKDIRDSSEHQLVDAKYERRDASGAHRRGGKDALESKVLEITDVGISGFAECK
jgi:hypothetical protein